MRLIRHEGPLPGPVNLGNPVELTVGDLVERVLMLTGSPSTVVTRPLPVDDPRRRPDISRATKLLGWMPRTPLEMGFKGHDHVVCVPGEPRRRGCPDPGRAQPRRAGLRQAVSSATSFPGNSIAAF